MKRRRRRLAVYDCASNWEVSNSNSSGHNKHVFFTKYIYFMIDSSQNLTVTLTGCNKLGFEPVNGDNGVPSSMTFLKSQKKVVLSIPNWPNS